MQNQNTDDAAPSVRDTLFGLNINERIERKSVLRDYLFYQGKCKYSDIKKLPEIYLGQSWKTNDNVDYVPTQDIRNKVKPLLKKQARFMFGAKPDLLIKPDDTTNDTDTCEVLESFLNDVLESNQFWKITRQAFLMSTIKKRILLRIEVNKDEPMVIKYEIIEDFYYNEKNGKVLKVVFFEEDDKNALVDDDSKKIYYLHTYFYNSENETDPVTAYYTKDTYTNGNLSTPSATMTINTGFTTIPCWLIKNGGELNDNFGESDVENLMDLQMLYNKKNSDYADALRFQMFGSAVVIDGNTEDVNKLSIAPNGLQAIRTDDTASEKGRQATVQRQEYSMGNAEAVNSYLDRIEKDMRDILDMPSVQDLNNIPSAKAMKYMYNDLIARCEEKWSDWEPIFKALINFIIQHAYYSYPSLVDKSWENLNFKILINHNYPLPEDDGDKKTIAMQEVQTNVRSHRDYIKTFGDISDVDGEFNTIIQEISQITAAENEQMEPAKE